MTLDEAIEHCKYVAENCNKRACANDHSQLASWLMELREYRSRAVKYNATWLNDEYETSMPNTWKCTHCHTVQVLIDGTPKDNGYDYCPHCGAKMLKEEY